MPRPYIKRKLYPEKRGPKTGYKRDTPHRCRGCAKPLPLEEAYHAPDGRIQWVCKLCAANIAYRRLWAAQDAEKIETEIKRLHERLNILTNLRED